MGLVEGLASLLTAKGIVTFDPTGITGDVFIGDMPPTVPDQAVSITISGGTESDSLLPYDEPLVQIRVRGTADPRVSRDRAAQIWSALHGLSDRLLPDGTYLVLAVAVQPAPNSIGMDDLQRHEHTFDLRCEILNVTDNRL
jgi:hypothetical protein